MWNQKPLSLRLQLQIHWNIVLVNCSSQYLSFVSQCLWFCKFCKIFCCSRIEKAKVFVRLAIIFWMHIWQHWFTGLFWKWLLWFQCWVSLGAIMAPHNFLRSIHMDQDGKWQTLSCLCICIWILQNCCWFSWLSLIMTEWVKICKTEGAQPVSIGCCCCSQLIFAWLYWLLVFLV